MSSGTYTFSSACTTTGTPAPLFHTDTVPAVGSTSTRSSSMVLSRTWGWRGGVGWRVRRTSARAPFSPAFPLLSLCCPPR